MLDIEIKGFVAKPKKTSTDETYHGRFTCHDVQWTGNSKEAMASFTATAEQIADAAESRILWTDQNVQRGIRPDIITTPERVLPIANGYPDENYYIFNSANADDIVEKLLSGERLFLNPLIWNLRPGDFSAYWEKKKKKIYIYSGCVYLPDSHHRHQAIVKAVKIWRESPSSYPKFNGNKQFKIELYFLHKEDEGNYFFDKNQRPKRTEKSKAYDLTTQDDLSLLAKRFIEKCTALKDNVNRVTDRLSEKNTQVVTLSTLRDMMKSFATSETLDEAELDGLATVAAKFYDLLAQARSELGQQTINDRKNIRANLIVDSAVMMHGYASLMREYNECLSREGQKQTDTIWLNKVNRLKKENTYKYQNWAGDIFAKNNPLWQKIGVVKPGKEGKRLTVSNTGAVRSECSRVLKQLLSVEQTPSNIEFLIHR